MATVTTNSPGLGRAQRSGLPGLPLSQSGAIGDGTTDDRTALQSFITANAGKTLFVDRTYAISEYLLIPSSTRLVGHGGFVILDPDTSAIRIDGSGVVLNDFSITSATAGTAAYVGAVFVNSGTDNTVDGLTITGFNWSGVYLLDAARNTVKNCRISTIRGTVQDSAGVHVYGSSIDNVVRDNKIDAACWHGVLVQDPYLANVPKRNIVQGNNIQNCVAYGVVVYLPTADGVSENQVIGNIVKGIVGSVLSGNSGAGIYIAGDGVIETVIADNTISNCCISTSSTTLVPAGIGINGSSKTRVAGNKISGMTKYSGIYATGADDCVVFGNHINMPSANTTAGGGIYMLNCDRPTIESNHVLAESGFTPRSVFIRALDQTTIATRVINNVITAGNTSPAFEALGVSLAGFKLDGVYLAGNKIVSSVASSQSTKISYGKDVQLIGNTLISGAWVLQLAHIDECIAVGNRLETTGTPNLLLSGALTEFFWAGSNKEIGGARSITGISSGTPYFETIDSVSADKGDAAATLSVTTVEKTHVWNTPITADRAVTLSTTGITNGYEFLIVRTAAATGAFNLNVGTGPLKALAVGQWCRVAFSAGAWMLVAFGSL